MSQARLWRAILGVERTVVEGVELEDESQDVVVRVRAARRARGRCGVCRRPCSGYDQGAGRRRWRHLDAGLARVWLEAESPRVRCRVHGVVVAHTPWARHGAGHTRAFDDTVAWLAVATSKTAVTALMRIAWRTVGAIVARVAEEAMAASDRFAGLQRIGIDEISYKRGYRYMLVVVDHDSGRLVWAAAGRNKATLRSFFDQLGPQRSAQITQVSADAAQWIAEVVAERAPNATQCADAFHVVAWATDAIDAVRREAWNTARKNASGGRRNGIDRDGRPRVDPRGTAKALKTCRYALWKNPENLTEKQTTKLAWVAKTDPRLYRAYLLKEGLRHVFVVKGDEGKEALQRWLSWARRCRIPAFVELGRKITRNLKTIEATLEHGLSNGLIESTNTKIRLLTRIAFGFKNVDALIALAMLALGGYRPHLPHQTS